MAVVWWQMLQNLNARTLRLGRQALRKLSGGLHQGLIEWLKSLRAASLRRARLVWDYAGQTDSGRRMSCLM